MDEMLYRGDLLQHEEEIAKDWTTKEKAGVGVGGGLIGAGAAAQVAGDEMHEVGRFYAKTAARAKGLKQIKRGKALSRGGLGALALGAGVGAAALSSRKQRMQPVHKADKRWHSIEQSERMAAKNRKNQRAGMSATSLGTSVALGGYLVGKHPEKQVKNIGRSAQTVGRAMKGGHVSPKVGAKVLGTVARHNPAGAAIVGGGALAAGGLATYGANKVAEKVNLNRAHARRKSNFYRRSAPVEKGYTMEFPRKDDDISKALKDWNDKQKNYAMAGALGGSLAGPVGGAAALHLASGGQKKAVKYGALGGFGGPIGGAYAGYKLASRKDTPKVKAKKKAVVKSEFPVYKSLTPEIAANRAQGHARAKKGRDLATIGAAAGAGALLFGRSGGIKSLKRAGSAVKAGAKLNRELGGKLPSVGRGIRAGGAALKGSARGVGTLGVGATGAGLYGAGAHQNIKGQLQVKQSYKDARKK